MDRFSSRRPTRRIVFALALAFLVGSVASEAQYFAEYQANYFGKNKIAYEYFDWHIYHSPHFDVYYYPGEEKSLEKIVSMAESAYDRLSQRLDYQIKQPTPLLIYATHSAFEQNNILVGFIPEGVGAFASPARFRMVMPIDQSDSEQFELVMHELTHVFQYHILFQGNLGRALTSRLPTWFIEGMASYMANDEQSWDKMYLRDAVVNDQIPPITRSNVQGYFAYRFGHAVFDYIQEKYGPEGVLDLLYEVRNTIGGNVGRAVQRAFRVDPEEFDAQFRRWLRHRYLPALVESGEPSDFGRPFRASERRSSWQSSGVASPSGDLLAAFTTLEGEVDLALFDTRHRRLVRNLTSGYTNDYQYLVAQNLTVGRRMGNDLSFSPDGNQVAVFAKRESGRSLVLIGVLSGKVDRIIDMDKLGVEQQLSPAFSPDGTKVAFSAWKDGQFDIFAYDLETGELTHVTDDDLFDGSPVYSPDGKSLVFSSVVGGYQKLFRVDLSDPSSRVQLSYGDSNERDAAFSPDGKSLYFTSDKSGAENVYSVDLETGKVLRWTDAVTGCLMPTAYVNQDGSHQVVYTGYWKRRFDLYRSDPAVAPKEVTGEPALIRLGQAPEKPAAISRYEPDIQVTLDKANEEKYHGNKLYIESLDTLIAVDSGSNLYGLGVVSFADQTGDRRLSATFSAVSYYSYFDLGYTNLAHRTNWSLDLYDTRTYFYDVNNRNQLQRKSLYGETGFLASAAYPLDFYHRVELGAGVAHRNINRDAFALNRRTQQLFLVYSPREDTFPIVRAALAGDTTLFADYGPISGRRWRLSADYSPDFKDGGTLTTNYLLDARQYIPVTRRSNFALRAYAAVSDGNFTQPTFVGGLDTIRGLKFRSEVGDRAFFANAEYRFPVIDILKTPAFTLQEVRGLVFFDIGGAYFSKLQDYTFYDHSTDRLQDGLSSYGLGVSAVIFGLPLNWDFAKLWDLKHTYTGFQTSFWIGTRF